MFDKILIANRGEIACRVIATARRLSVKTVAVYSDADRAALHVALADEAVAIGPAPAAESYLRGEAIVAAAHASGAQAIHPGYGFLAENPDFVALVEAAGLLFIGPSAEAIRAMGLKDAAKQLMEKAGVPVVPGYHGSAQEIVVLAGKAQDLGYPVLIKARAGGGGKGLRRVDEPEGFAEALAAARREAKAAFGDDRVLIEKYVETPRHIEVQVFGDNHGNVVHLFERDCSAQRRHQKVIEEAPAPGMTREMRAAMTAAAVKAAKAIRYTGAGTVEFIADASEGLRADRFWFMEMNTRLQVEHPVTEMITGLDLVEWQLRVAAGEALPRSQNQIAVNGHAFEARLYAEDPARDFLPATGRLHHIRFPQLPPQRASLRVDSGVRAGDEISPFYDPLIAKLIVHAAERDAALTALAGALRATEIAGATTNLAFLIALAEDPDFAAGKVDTGLIARRHERLVARNPATGRVLATAALLAFGARACGDSRDPWSTLQGYAHFHPLTQQVRFSTEGAEIEASVRARADGLFDVELAPDGERFTLPAPAAAGRGEGSAGIARWPGHITLFADGRAHDFTVADPLARAAVAAAPGGALRAPMPGFVKLVRVAAGESVGKGQPLLVLEAMKMEHTILAPADGVIAEIVTQGAQVSDGTVLVRFAD